MWGEFMTGELKHGKLHGGERRGQQQKRRELRDRQRRDWKGGKRGRKRLSINAEFVVCHSVVSVLDSQRVGWIS